MKIESASALTPAAIMTLAKVCRHSCRVIRSSVPPSTVGRRVSRTLPA
jgi:hypothetical protein